MKVKRADCIRLDKQDKTYFTEEGYFVDHPILTSCGIFEYTNPDGSIRRELRLPEHVFSKKSLETYKGKPIIITHDAGIVDKDNVDSEQIGTILSEAYRDGDDVRAEIIIHNTDAMKDSGLKELSLGYDLDLIEEPGEWRGEPYDAIQTNIVINHLALVGTARAGKKARLNVDSSDEQIPKGGKIVMKHIDAELTPEEMKQAIADFKAKKEAEDNGNTDSRDNPEDNADCGNKDGEGEGKSPEEIAAAIKERRENADEDAEPKKVIAQQDEDIDKLLAVVEALVAKLKAGNTDGDDNGGDGEENPDNTDSSEDESKSMNADSVDAIISKKLEICRVGDKLRMDGLETMNIKDGKKAIIKKVYPDMRLDGKSDAYVDACYDMALGEVNKRKDIDYQRRQMIGGSRHADGQSEEKSMASEARQRMIDREGGNQ